MPIKKVLVKHILRKGFLGKGLEHYLRNRLRIVFKAIPNIKTRQRSGCTKYSKY